MKKSEWGPMIWDFLHVFTLKIKEKEFIENKKVIIELLFGVCDNLPCPNCASHARGFLNKIRFSQIKQKEILIKAIWTMHNEVNKKNKTPFFEYDKLNEVYMHKNFEQVAIHYFKSLSKMNYGEKMMLYSFQRQRFVKKFVPIIRDNIKWFS